MPRGKIVSVIAKKEFGFIRPTDGSVDLFFHSSTIDHPLHQLEIGQEVEFEVDSAAEKPRARQVRIWGPLLKKTGGGADEGGRGGSRFGRDKSGDRRRDSQRPGRPRSDARANRGDRAPIVVKNGALGEIAAIQPEKGFGFIKPQDGGEDLFFHHSAVDRSLESLVVGQQVEFEIDSKADKPRAGKVALRGEISSPKSNAAYRPPHEIENGREGTIASLVVSKGFGFIKPSDGGDEVFFHDSVSDHALEQLVTGQPVEFEMDANAVKARASKVAVRGELLAKPSQAEHGHTVVENGRAGEVVSLVVEKGFGFVRPRDGGDDVFFHNSTVDYPFESLVVGQEVEFALDDQADKPRAKQVAVRGNVRTSSDGRAAHYPRSKIERGFVTKMLWKTRQGFISPDQGGAELLFEQQDVSGETMYTALKIGDYVEFVRTGQIVRTKIDKAPTATAVKVIEKEIKKLPTKELPNNPKARRKKPTWRR